MAEKTEGLVYRKRPLRRVGKMIYYGSMADSHIILMQIKETKREQDMEIARYAMQIEGGTANEL